jgi:hypothetical protein
VAAVVKHLRAQVSLYEDELTAAREEISHLNTVVSQMSGLLRAQGGGLQRFSDARGKQAGQGRGGRGGAEVGGSSPGCARRGPTTTTTEEASSACAG